MSRVQHGLDIFYWYVLLNIVHLREHIPTITAAKDLKVVAHVRRNLVWCAVRQDLLRVTAASPEHDLRSEEHTSELQSP